MSDINLESLESQGGQLANPGWQLAVKTMVKMAEVCAWARACVSNIKL